MIAKTLQKPWVLLILALAILTGLVWFISHGYSTAISDSVQSRYPLGSQFADLKIDPQSIHLDITNQFKGDPVLMAALPGYRIPKHGLESGERLVVVQTEHFEYVAHLYFCRSGELCHIEISGT